MVVVEVLPVVVEEVLLAEVSMGACFLEHFAYLHLSVSGYRQIKTEIEYISVIVT